jgi:DNA-binding HxlR family transcriptional regulator
MSDHPQTAQEGTFLKPEHTKVTRHVDVPSRSKPPVLPPNAHLESDCRGAASILARVGDKWSVFVIVRLGGGPRRFNEIKRMVTRTVFPTIPPRVDYELTDLGRGLWTPVEALGKWAQEHQVEIEDARARFDRRNEAS